jgi:hypothetical protein
MSLWWLLDGKYVGGSQLIALLLLEVFLVEAFSPSIQDIGNKQDLLMTSKPVYLDKFVRIGHPCVNHCLHELYISFLRGSNREWGDLHCDIELVNLLPD